MKRKARSKYMVALRIVFHEMKKRRSLKPLTWMWKKQWYGRSYPYRIIATLPDYINFCRVNGIAVYAPEEMA